MLAAAFSLFFISCEGPQGPPGKFIFHRFDETVSQAAWLPVQGDVSTWYCNIAAPEITDFVLSEGFVLVYIRDANLNSWTLLPDVLVYHDTATDPYTTYSIETRAWVEKGNVYLTYTNSHPFAPVRPSYDMIFRVVTFDSFLTPALKPVDFQDYNKVESFMKNSGTVTVREMVMERK